MHSHPTWSQREDEEGLGNFGGDETASQSTRRGGKGGKGKYAPYEAGPPRTKLYRMDQTSAVLFNPYGKAYIPDNRKELYEKVAKGDKKAAFHSELAAKEATGGDYRVGIGISRTAATLLEAVALLESNNVKAIIKDKYYDQAKNEMEALKPHLKVVLNTQTSAALCKNKNKKKKKRKQPKEKKAEQQSYDTKTRKGKSLNLQKDKQQLLSVPLGWRCWMRARPPLQVVQHRLLSLLLEHYPRTSRSRRHVRLSTIG